MDVVEFVDGLKCNLGDSYEIHFRDFRNESEIILIEISHTSKYGDLYLAYAIPKAMFVEDKFWNEHIADDFRRQFMKKQLKMVRIENEINAI